MIRSVALLEPQRNSYGVITQFTQQLHQAFQQLGIASSIIDSDQGMGHVLDRLKEEKTDLSICFNGPLPGPDGKVLPDYSGIPHLSYLLDPPYIFLGLKDHPLIHLGCVDRSHCELLETLGCPRSLFLPHAADRQMLESEEQEKDYDLVLLASSVDPEALRERWVGQFGEEAAQLMEQLGKQVLEDARSSTLAMMERSFQIPLAQLFTAPIAGMHPVAIWREVELYVRAVDRLDLVCSLSKFSIHVFGNAYGADTRGWTELLADSSHVTVHPAVDYTESLEIMRRSRIVLNSSPFFKHGAHERIFTALACGAAVLSTDNPFLRQSFNPQEGVLSYRPGKAAALQKRIRALLDDDERYKRSVAAGKEKVTLWHCWESRAEQILKSLAG